MAEARSLADIKLDNAYKFGAGRYLQEAGALNLLGGEVARLGKKALVIAGPRAWAATEGKAEKSLKMPVWSLNSPCTRIRTPTSAPRSTPCRP